MVQNNRELVQQFYETLWNQKELSKLDDFITADFIWHEPINARDFSGNKSAQQFFVDFFVAFPDYQIVLEDLVAEGDRVAVRWTAYGTHRGALKGIPPTGKSMALPGMSFLRVQAGRLAEYWTSLDNFLMLCELGVIGGSS